MIDSSGAASIVARVEALIADAEKGNDIRIESLAYERAQTLLLSGILQELAAIRLQLAREQSDA